MNTNSMFDLNFTEHLPSPSGTALAIMRLTQQEDANLQQMAQIVKTDPALSARIVNFANSAALGGKRSIVNVEEATLRIGMKAICNLALSLSLLDQNRQGNCPEFDYEGYWSHSLAIATSIAAITAHERTVPPEEAFTLGLLSNIGSLAMASVWPETYGKCLEHLGDSLLKFEQENFDIDHQSLTIKLLGEWGIPELFLEALRLSFGEQATDITRIGRFARQLKFARLLAKFCLSDSNHKSALWEGIEKEACFHALNKSSLGQFLDNIVVQWQALGNGINIKTDIHFSTQGTKPKSDDGQAKLQILLVEHDSVVANLLIAQLSALGYWVAVSPDADAALKYAIEHRPAIMIVEQELCVKDGLSLCKLIRNSDFGKNIYIILLTATEFDADTAQGSLDDYLTKPVDFNLLKYRIFVGSRIARLQEEVKKEREDIQHYLAEMIANNRRLEKMAHTDMLTDLPNRRYALHRLAQEFEAGLRLNQPLNIMILDLDHFKLVNDTLGHDIGDQVLVYAANLIKQSVRTGDIVCRLGGEEFIVIAPNTDGKTANSLAERIRRVIEIKQIPTIHLNRPVTVSIGVAGTDINKSNCKDLLVLADKAMYRVKQEGRNNVQLASHTLNRQRPL